MLARIVKARLLALWLGHERVETTQIYVKPRVLHQAGEKTAGHLVSAGTESVQVPDGTGLLTCTGFLTLPPDA